MKSIDIEAFSVEATKPIIAILELLTTTHETVELKENGKTVYSVAGGSIKKIVGGSVDFPREAAQDKSKRIPGTAKGQICVSPDFDELPDDVAKAFGMID